MIEPTIGRVVHYHDPDLSDQPCTAHVCYVHHERMVNLRVFDANGEGHPRTSVQLVQPGDEAPEHPHATWMPYQVKKDHGSESGEREAGETRV